MKELVGHSFVLGNITEELFNIAKKINIKELQEEERKKVIDSLKILENSEELKTLSQAGDLKIDEIIQAAERVKFGKLDVEKAAKYLESAISKLAHLQTGMDRIIALFKSYPQRMELFKKLVEISQNQIYIREIVYQIEPTNIAAELLSVEGLSQEFVESIYEFAYRTHENFSNAKARSVIKEMIKIDAGLAEFVRWLYTLEVATIVKVLQSLDQDQYQDSLLKVLKCLYIKNNGKGMEIAQLMGKDEKEFVKLKLSPSLKKMLGTQDIASKDSKGALSPSRSASSLNEQQRQRQSTPTFQRSRTLASPRSDKKSKTPASAPAAPQTPQAGADNLPGMEPLSASAIKVVPAVKAIASAAAKAAKPGAAVANAGVAVSVQASSSLSSDSKQNAAEIRHQSLRLLRQLLSRILLQYICLLLRKKIAAQNITPTFNSIEIEGKDAVDRLENLKRKVLKNIGNIVSVENTNGQKTVPGIVVYSIIALILDEKEITFSSIKNKLAELGFIEIITIDGKEFRITELTEDEKNKKIEKLKEELEQKLSKPEDQTESTSGPQPSVPAGSSSVSSYPTTKPTSTEIPAEVGQSKLPSVFALQLEDEQETKEEPAGVAAPLAGAAAIAGAAKGAANLLSVEIPLVPSVARIGGQLSALMSSSEQTDENSSVVSHPAPASAPAGNNGIDTASSPRATTQANSGQGTAKAKKKKQPAPASAQETEQDPVLNYLYELQKELGAYLTEVGMRDLEPSDESKQGKDEPVSASAPSSPRKTGNVSPTETSSSQASGDVALTASSSAPSTPKAERKEEKSNGTPVHRKVTFSRIMKELTTIIDAVDKNISNRKLKKNYDSLKKLIEDVSKKENRTKTKKDDVIISRIKDTVDLAKKSLQTKRLKLASNLVKANTAQQSQSAPNSARSVKEKAAASGSAAAIGFKAPTLSSELKANPKSQSATRTQRGGTATGNTQRWRFRGPSAENIDLAAENLKRAQILQNATVAEINEIAAAILPEETLEEIAVFIQNLAEKLKQTMERVLEPKVAQELRGAAEIRGWDLTLVSKDDYSDLQTTHERIVGGIQAHLYMSSGMVKILAKLSKILTKEKFDELVEQIFLHERIEVLKAEQLKTERTAGNNNFTDSEIAQKSHDFAVEFSGDKQKALFTVMGDIEILQNPGDIVTREDLKKLQNSIDNVRAALFTISGREYSQVEILDKFENARGAITEFIANSEVDQREVVVDITKTKGNQVGILLQGMGLMNNGVLKPGLRVILAGDMADPSNSQAVKGVITLMKEYASSSIEWVPGKAILEVMDGNQELRKLAIAGHLKVVTALSSGYLLTGSGYVSDEVVAMAKKETGSQDISATILSDFLNSLLMLKYEDLQIDKTNI